MVEDSFQEELNNNLVQNPSGKVVERTFMQKIVYRVYPNGNIAIVQSKSKCWFTDSKDMWKKKHKKKAKEMQKTIIEEEEVY